MKVFLVRKAFHTMMAALHALMSVLLFIPGAAHSQDIDTQPPQINVEAVQQGIRGDSQVFTATVTDNLGVEGVTLFYRFGEDSLYQSSAMALLGATDIYTTTVATDAIDSSVESIQYYVEAKDQAGNRTLQGFAFDPRERLLIDKTAPVADSSTAAEEPKAGMSTSRKIAYGVLGLIVVGALASAGGGGGGSEEPGVGVTVVVDQLQ